MIGRVEERVPLDIEHREVSVRIVIQGPSALSADLTGHGPMVGPKGDRPAFVDAARPRID